MPESSIAIRQRQGKTANASIAPGGDRALTWINKPYARG
jgi:hypothetical protein